MSSQASLVRDAIRNIALLFILIAAPLLYAGYWQIGEVNRQQAMKALDERAALVLQLLENDLQNKLQSLEHATGILRAKDFSAVNRADVVSISDKFNGVAWSGLVGLDGTVLFSTQGILEGVNVSARPWFKAGMSMPSILDRHDALLLASKLPPRAEPYKFIDMAVPVLSNENKLVGVLGIHIDWTWYQNQFSDLLGVQPSTSVISSVITGKDGELRLAKLGANQGAEDLKQMLAAINHSGVESDKFLISSLTPPERSKLASLGWTIHLIRPTQAVTNQTISAISLAMGALLAGMLTISLLMIYSARRLSNRIATHLDVIEHKSVEEMARSEATLPREAMPLMVRTRELFTRAQIKAQMLKEQLAKAQLSFTEINSLIQQAPVAIAMFDREMNYLACSELWKKTFFTGSVDPVGQSHYRVVSNIPQQWREFHARGMQGEAIQRENDCWTDAHGQEFWLNWSIQPWRNKDQQVGGIIVATEDVSASHKALAALAASEERFQLAMEGSNDGLWDWSLSDNSVYFSPGWKRMLGYAPDELPHQFDVWRQLLNPEDKEASEAYLEKTIANPDADSLNLGFRLAHKNGGWVKVLSRGKIIRDASGNAVRVVGTHLDRTEIERLQSELQEAWVVAQAEAHSNEAKSKFLATVSHEIRNPLNAVTGFARLIVDESTDDRVTRYAQMLNQTTDSLRLILNDILDFAKIDAGKLEIVQSDFSLSELIDTMAESTRLQCMEKSIGFELSKKWDSTEHFNGDAGRIRQIAQNLLSNAIKFTSEGLIQFNARTFKLDDTHDQLILEIIDTGIGIPQDKLDRLFKPFSQIHNDSASKYGGTGLGLTIVKSLAEAMGGEVHCVSAEGKGSTFTIRLPLRRVAEPVRKSLNQAVLSVLNATHAPKRVLVADDMPSNLHIMDAFLSKRGHIVTTVDNGADALKQLQIEAFDFVLLDLEMPGLSGLDVVKSVRTSGGVNHTAVFACVTGNALRETMNAAHDAGFDLFIPKPVDFDQLLAAVNR